MFIVHLFFITKSWFIRTSPLWLSLCPGLSDNACRCPSSRARVVQAVNDEIIKRQTSMLKSLPQSYIRKTSTSVHGTFDFQRTSRRFSLKWFELWKLAIVNHHSPLNGNTITMNKRFRTWCNLGWGGRASSARGSTRPSPVSPSTRKSPPEPWGSLIKPVSDHDGHTVV